MGTISLHTERVNVSAIVLKLLVVIEEASKQAYYEVEQLRDVERYSLFTGVRELAEVVFLCA